MAPSESESSRSSVNESQQRLTDVACDLHDGLLQYVIGAKMLNEALQRRLKSQSCDVPAELDSVQSYLEHAIAEGRRLIDRIEATAEEKLDVVRLLRSLESSPHFEGTPKVHLRIADDLDVESELQAALYRIAQEALSNVRRHSGASEVEVSLERNVDRLTLQVNDNGCGFDSASVPAASFGLRSMARRAASIGGTFRLNSRPGHGTQLRVDVPVDAKRL